MKKPCKKAQAHHIFPQRFREEFLKKGINVDHPKYGIWWESNSHQRLAFKYNEQWAQFLRKEPATGEILEYGRKLMNDYGFRINY